MDAGLAVDMVRINDPGEMIQQLPSNYWMNLVLEEFDNRDHLLEYKMQCTYCHQQGSPLTSRRQFTREQWVDIIHDMGRRSAIISNSLKAELPDHLLAAYDDANVLRKLPAYDGENGPLPLPSAEVREAVIEEWQLGGPTVGTARPDGLPPGRLHLDRGWPDGHPAQDYIRQEPGRRSHQLPDSAR